jgi:hypothetical protein
MKTKIQELIKHHTEAKNEVSYFLEELSQIDTSKLDSVEKEALRDSKLKYEDELYFRRLFLQDLENLL